MSSDFQRPCPPRPSPATPWQGTPADEPSSMWAEARRAGCGPGGGEGEEGRKTLQAGGGGKTFSPTTVQTRSPPHSSPHHLHARPGLPSTNSTHLRSQGLRVGAGAAAGFSTEGGMCRGARAGSKGTFSVGKKTGPLRARAHGPVCGAGVCGQGRPGRSWARAKAHAGRTGKKIKSGRECGCECSICLVALPPSSRPPGLTRPPRVLWPLSPAATHTQTCPPSPPVGRAPLACTRACARPSRPGPAGRPARSPRPAPTPPPSSPPRARPWRPPPWRSACWLVSYVGGGRGWKGEREERRKRFALLLRHTSQNSP